MALEIVRSPNGAASFLRAAEREARSTLWNFSVVWHEQHQDFTAELDGTQAGAARIRIAASLAAIEWCVVLPEYRLRGIGRRLLESAEEVANYYNCHKMTVEVLHQGGAQSFFERCGYKLDAILRQHTWKLDVAVMRKFLL